MVNMSKVIPAVLSGHDADPQCWLHHTIQRAARLTCKWVHAYSRKGCWGWGEHRHMWWMCQRSAPIPAAWSGRWCRPTMLTTSYNTNQATHTWHTTSYNTNQATHTWHTTSYNTNQATHTWHTTSYNTNQATHTWHTTSYNTNQATHTWHTTSYNTNQATHTWHSVIIQWCRPTMLTTSYNTNQATHTWHTTSYNTNQATHTWHTTSYNTNQATHTWHTTSYNTNQATHTWHTTSYNTNQATHTWHTTSYNTNQATHTWHLWWTCQGCPGPAPIPAAWSGRWCRRSRRTAASPRCPCSSAGESWGTGSNNKLCQNRFHLPLHSPLPSPTSLPDHFSMDLHSVFNLDWAELDWSQWVHPLVKAFLKLQGTEEGLKHKWHFVSDISGTEPAFTGACWWVLLPPRYTSVPYVNSPNQLLQLLRIRDCVLCDCNYRGLKVLGNYRVKK